MENTKKTTPPSVRYIEITDEQQEQRVDNFLLTLLKGVPKSHIYRILRKGEVRVNKGRIKPTYRLQSGDMVRIPPVRVSEKPAPIVGDRLLKELESRVLFENAGLLVVNKPSGLAVHGGSGLSFGLIEAFRQLRPEEKSLELVHRLDRDTSGCVMIAKKRSILRALHQMLREGGIDKRYTALVAGRWSKRKTVVDAPLEKNVLQSGERLVKVSPDGKKSKTEFSILRNLVGATLVEARPITGRTHQIRVHAQYAGHALIGDEKYGNDELNRAMRNVGIKRLFLHASSLSFNLPDGGGLINVQSILDNSLEKALDKLSK